MEYLYVINKRCYDRKFSFNHRITRKVTQAEYEDIYTGPEFIL